MNNVTPPGALRPADTAAPARRSRSRRIGFVVLAILVLIAAGLYLAMRLMAPSAEETDDAYVGGNVVAVTARDGGTVMSIDADNTQAVTRGQTLIELDPATADVQLASAEAALGQAVRAVRSNAAQVDAADAEIAQAKADLSKAHDDLVRRRGAAAQGAISGEELSHAADAVSTLQAALDLARARRAQAASTVEGTSLDTNPQVLAAIAMVRRAAIDRSHMRITAPISGMVAQRTVQLGQRVAAGTPLMAVIPLNSLWIDANFRETQLRYLRVGQPVTITADIYGGATVFHGRVLGVGAGSGSAFALLPPQNASGNWIKIVQRVPVRIGLDPNELARNALRIGLSVDVTVQTADRSGPLVGGSMAPAGGIERSLDGGPQIEASIRRIIAANMGQSEGHD